MPLQKSAAPLRILVVSSVRPEPTSAGEITLHRHLVGCPDLSVRIVEPHREGGLVARLKTTRFHKMANGWEILRNAKQWDKSVDEYVRQARPDAIITVGHGDGCWSAARLAIRYNLPLVTFFHDWWPDMISVHPPFQKLLEKRFRELYHQSRLALCVSEGMCAQLGTHSGAQVLYPIPAKINSLPPSPKPHDRFRLFYHGNLYDYGPMVAYALTEMKHHPQVRLEVRGGNPQWPQAFRQEMERAGLWHDYAPRAELDEWLGSADAFLVPMVFEPALRRRMETSFPSKMLEMAQMGKPLIIWGPEYCSAVQWARQGTRALCVTDSDPAALREALEALRSSPAEQQRLAAAAQHAAQTDFNPDEIQAQFMKALRGVVVTENQ
jgi:glycosyltransferase involved in cell wall biosynthesis